MKDRTLAARFGMLGWPGRRQRPPRRRPPPKGGRPTLRTPDAALRLVAGIRAGLTFTEAAREAGLSRTLAYRWRSECEALDAACDSAMNDLVSETIRNRPRPERRAAESR